MTYKTQAIVLKSISWPRNARMFVLYTKRFGKIKGVAAGIEKIKSKVAGHLQPFCVTEVMIAKGRNIDRLAQARFVYGHSGITNDFPLFLKGSYVLEVLDALTKEGISDEAIWENLLAVLQEIDNGQWNGAFNGNGDLLRYDLMTRVFSLQLLTRMGYRPELYNCIYCREFLKPDRLFFSVIQGGVVCAKCKSQNLQCSEISVDLIKYFREVVNQPFNEVSKLLLSHESAGQAIDIIDQLVTMQTQKPLKTQHFIRTIQEEGILV